ncbi:uncharacterized protein LOC116800399 [Drosophila sechellia]|uniref:uncharacterized protein LOC116800399 n=1 Tax=Drosophila sechellia TaxID=7238 RepID=UPI0013DDE351|nr:uncharacterized protein LOC116800399 [Drosophila sechellia]
MPKILSCLALGIYFPFTYYLRSKFLPCLVHCFKYYSWEKCEPVNFENMLFMSAWVGASGLLWVSSNYTEFHFVFSWIIVTFELIVLEISYMTYAIILTKNHVWNWQIIFFGILVFSFVLVLLHVLVAKKIVKNHLIENIFRVLPDKTDN